MHSVGIATGDDAGALPITADEDLARGCAARLLISAPPERNVEVLARRIHEGGISDAVRLIAETTASLLERIAGGTFSGQLFYRLNIIHLMAGGGSSSLTRDDDAQDVNIIEPSAPKLPR